jgi:hypothetical protein
MSQKNESSSGLNKIGVISLVPVKPKRSLAMANGNF